MSLRVRRTDRRNKSTFVQLIVAVVVVIVLAVATSVGVVVSRKKRTASSSEVAVSEARPTGNTGTLRTSHDFDQNEFQKALEAKREEFSSLYGGDKASSEMLLASIISYSDRELGHTAERILAARAANRPFVIASAGYSVTTGRGNLHEQSFPFVVADVLKEPFELLGVQIETRNIGLGGVNSLPYGWCQQTFLGTDVDVVSWDFRFNEGSDSISFESFMRHSMLLPHAPKFVLMARKSASRKGVLKDYVERGWQVDPIVVDNSYPPENEFLSLPEEERPPGFQDFDKFGAPEGSPGQSPWNPTYQWHTMIAWIMGMHILQSADIAGQLIESGEGNITIPPENGQLLPSPTNDVDLCGTSAEASILYGKPVVTKDDIQWFMPKTSCSTTFSPTTEGTGLAELVVSGMIGEGDITEETEDLKGWILGFGSLHSREEHTQYSSLGFRDAKKSFHGFHTSGPLKLWIPWRDKDLVSGSSIGRSLRNVDDDRATSWFQYLFVCSFYEKADNSQCDLEKDIEFLVGGKEATKVSLLEAVGAQWMNKPLCVTIDIPEDAKTSTRGQAGLDGPGFSEAIGLVVSITITNSFLEASRSACSISHIVWQHATS